MLTGSKWRGVGDCHIFHALFKEGWGGGYAEKLLLQKQAG